MGPVLLLAMLWQPNPPAAVDAALRARINQFYEANVKKEYRKAEALAAEDSRDYFYNSTRPAWLSYSIAGVRYSDDGQRAEAIVNIERMVPFPGFIKPTRFQDHSYWKLSNGEWWWYTDPAKAQATPFGIMKPGPGEHTGTFPVVTANPREVDAKVKALAR